MAVRYLTSRRRDGPAAVVAALCTCGVSVGVFALVVALALISGFQSEVRTRLLASNPHVVVRAAPGRPAYDAREVARLTALARSEGAIAVAPFASELGILRSQLVPSGAFVQLKGIDPRAEDRVTGLAAQSTSLGWAALLEDARRVEAPHPEAGAASEDDAEALDEAALRPPVLPAVLLGDGLASDLGVAPGDVVHLVSSGELSALGPVLKSRALRVVGLVHTGLHEYDHMEAIAVLGRLAVLPGGGIEGIEMSLADPQESSAAAERIASRLGGDHVVSDWTTTFARLFAAMRFEKIVLFAIGLIGLVAGFNIFTILTLNVTARTADIGVLAALGATAGAITRIFTWMGLLIGGVGTAGGLLAGVVGATWLDRRHLIALDPAVYLVSQISFRVVPQDLAFVAGSMLLVSLLATWLPARAAARLDPVVALRSA